MLGPKLLTWIATRVGLGGETGSGEVPRDGGVVVTELMPSLMKAMRRVVAVSWVHKAHHCGSPGWLAVVVVASMVG